MGSGGWFVYVGGGPLGGVVEEQVRERSGGFYLTAVGEQTEGLFHVSNEGPK